MVLARLCRATQQGFKSTGFLLHEGIPLIHIIFPNDLLCLIWTNPDMQACTQTLNHMLSRLWSSVISVSIFDHTGTTPTHIAAVMVQ